MRLTSLICLLAFHCALWSVVRAQFCALPQAAGTSATAPYASRCSGIIQYPVQFDSTSTPLRCAHDMENSLALVDSSASVVSANCHSALLAYHCRYLFPPCGGSSTDLQPQAEVCSNVNAKCTPTEIVTVNALYTANGRKFPSTRASLGFSVECTNATQTINNTMDFTAPARRPLCEPYTGSVCSTAIDYNVFVPQYAAINGVTTQAAIEAQLSVSVPLFFNVLLSAPTCRDAMVKLVCATAFGKCSRVTTLNLAAPSFPDRSLCDLVSASCPANLVNSTLGRTLGFSNCAALFDPNAGSTVPRTAACLLPDLDSVPRFPLNYSNFSGIIVSSNTQESISADALRDTVTCFAPTVKTTDRDVAISISNCAAPCPSVIYTHDQYYHSDRVMFAFSLLSLITSSILLITYAAFKRARKKMYTIYFTINVWAVSLFLTFAPAVEGADGVYGWYAKMQCKDSSHPANRGYCLWLSMVMIFCGFSAVCWWCVQAVDLYLSIAWGASKWSVEKTRRKEIVYMSIAYGYPLCLLIICLSADELGSANQGVPYCLFGPSSTADGLGWGLFYGPIMAQCVVGFLCMFFIMRQLWVSSAQLQTHKKRGWWKLYIKPLIFVAIFEVVWIIIFTFRIDGQVRTSTLRADARTYLGCVLVQVPAATLQGQTLECVRPTPNVSLWYLLQVAVAGVGLWAFCLYNTGENVIMWYHFLTCKPYNYSNTDDTSTTSGGGAPAGGATKQGSRRVLRTKKQGTTKSTSPSASAEAIDVPLDQPLPTNISIEYKPTSSTQESAPAPEENENDNENDAEDNA